MASSARTSMDNEYVEIEQPPTSSLQSLSRAVHARRADYTRPQKIKVKIGSWNVAACPGTDKDLAGWFVQGKGIDKKLAGLKVADGIENNGSQEHIESVGSQEARRTKEEPTIPLGDEGTIAGEHEIGLYVLGLQEVVDLTSTREYIGRVYNDTGPITKWRKALSDALPAEYELIAEQQLSGLLLFVYASPTVAPTISSVSTVSVGTGLMGYLGNKGAVTTRIMLGETTRMVFVNSHLASGNDPAHLDRRCWDVSQILQRTRFEPVSWAGVLADNEEGIGEEDFAFWFGDLNFRLDGLPGDDIRRLLMLHTKGEYDLYQISRKKIDGELGDQDGPIVIHSVDSDDDDDDSEDASTRRTSSTFDYGGDDASSTTLPDPDDFVQDPSQDPASLQATLDSLLPHDQLRHVQKKRKAFHDGWREGPITFLPTYKYDVGSMGMFDSSEKKRAPSWCDRILYRTRRDKLDYDRKTQEEQLARIKDEQMKARGIDHAGDDEDVLYDYDPDEDVAEELTPAPATNDYDEYDEGEDEEQGEAVMTKEGFVDRIHLDIYTSHQRVLSSDHKPLDAVFTLEYDAVVPELKSKVQQEVARELDRAENEGRPGITVVVDHSQEVEEFTNDSSLSNRKPSTGGVEGVEFGMVSFQKRKRRALTIANTSQVSSTFAFVERPSESGEGELIAPPWLTVSVGPELDEEQLALRDPKRDFTLEPGDAINAALDIFIDDIAMVRLLNEGTVKLDDVLVLRVTDGRDHFVPIRGSWLQSCFGRSIDELIRIPEGGVRALRPRPKGIEGGPVNRGQEVCWSAPRELFKLTEAVEALTDRVIAEAAMLENAQLPKEVAGWPFDQSSWLLRDGNRREIQKGFVLAALDSDKNLNESLPPETPAMERLEIMAEVLVMFLGSITDGIVTESLWTKLDADITARSAAKQTLDTEETKAWVLDVLSASPNHNISFVFLTSMLNRVASELAPIPNSRWKEDIVGSARHSMDSVRRSLSWKGKAPPLSNDRAIVRRKAVEKAYANVFSHVIFRGPVPGKDKERKVMEDRRREMLEVFLRGSRDGS
jgi:phosphatidylinositol-bisphosphatase